MVLREQVHGILLKAKLFVLCNLLDPGIVEGLALGLDGGWAS
jgi:hypothetical protein